VPAFTAQRKAAARSFARNWTLDLKERKIRVNAVNPGVVPTPGYDLLGLTKEQVQAFVDFHVTTIPLGRVVPDEIAKQLCSLRPTTAASSTASNSLSMAAWRKSELHEPTLYCGDHHEKQTCQG
jgi:NAD(P)-dependent dehydrogenase (short-subunit alcohol dehydrogenase family)